MRLLKPAFRWRFQSQVVRRLKRCQPDVVIAYKGFEVGRELVWRLQREGAFTVNVYPDYAPNAYGHRHYRAVGAYDLVISTKPYHAEAWTSVYGYQNPCAYVPQGYDPKLHLIETPPSTFAFDVVMIATYRPEYGRLVLDLAQRLRNHQLKVAIGGFGWGAIRSQLPADWVFPGPVHGQGYLDLLRKGKICIAPLTRNVIIDGRVQPGDVDTTRTYELAAAHCFFIHQKTDFLEQIYSPDEVPLFKNSEHLGELILYYLSHEDERRHMAFNAHRRAVPAYSLDSRAEEIITILIEHLQATKM